MSNIAIAVTSDSGYLPAACCQLLSTSTHLSAEHRAKLFLVLCDVTDEEVEECRRFFDRREIDVTIELPKAVADSIEPIGNRWPRAAYLRLYFDRIFGADFSRMLYFDADTRVRSDLSPLVNVDLDGYAVGAVHDFIYYVTGNIRRRRTDLFLGPDGTYLQSGVMVLDWPKVLEADLLGQARTFLEEYPSRCFEAPDQDALNAVLKSDWRPLDPRWNLHETYLMFGGRHRPYIEHYTSTKPWSRLRPSAWDNAAAWYHKELADTAWSDFVEPVKFMDRLQSRAAFLRFRYAPKLRDALATNVPQVLRMMGKSPERSDDEELPWAPRNREDVETMTDALIEEAAGRRGPIRPPESALKSPP